MKHWGPEKVNDSSEITMCCWKRLLGARIQNQTFWLESQLLTPVSACLPVAETQHP